MIATLIAIQLQHLVVTFCCWNTSQAAPTMKVVYPLTAGQKVAIMRNIEKMIAEALNDNTEVSCSFIVRCFFI